MQSLGLDVRPGKLGSEIGAVPAEGEDFDLDDLTL
jgi:hypothetical protein